MNMDIPMIELLSATIADCARDYVDGRIAALEAKIARLEARPALKYAGVWNSAAGAYSPGDIVTHQGSAWICHTSTVATPGQTKDWQLMVKAGRDARSK